MSHRNSFSANEASKIKGLLQQKIDSGNQMRYRRKLRAMGFYISDYARIPSGFAPEDFDRFVESGDIVITENAATFNI